MAIVLIEKTDSGEEGAGIHGGTTTGIDTTGADFLVTTVGQGDGTAFETPTDSKSNTYTVDDESAGFFQCQHSYNVPGTVGPAHTATYTEVGSYCVITLAAFSGVHQIAPEDTGNTGGFSNESVANCGSVTPNVPGSLLIASMTYNDVAISGLTVPTGFTLIAHATASTGVNFGHASAYRIYDSTDAINPQWSWTTNAIGEALVTVFAPAERNNIIEISTGNIGDDFIISDIGNEFIIE